MRKIFVLFVVLTVVFPAGLSAECKIKPPTKISLEAMCGKRVKCYAEGMICIDDSGKKIECPKESDAKVCFQSAEGSAQASFGNDGKLISISLFHPCTYYSTHKLAEKIVSSENRGKFIKKSYISGEFDCDNKFVEEYECLKITYSSYNCAGCAPGGVTIFWN